MPQVTWGTSPEDVVPITGTVPRIEDFDTPAKQESVKIALDYMGLTPGMKMTDIKIDKIFVGSCTNSRIEDIRAVATISKGRKVADGVQALMVPGSGLVKAQAEAEGLDKNSDRVWLGMAGAWMFNVCRHEYGPARAR